MLLSHVNFPGDFSVVEDFPIYLVAWDNLRQAHLHKAVLLDNQ